MNIARNKRIIIAITVAIIGKINIRVRHTFSSYGAIMAPETEIIVRQVRTRAKRIHVRVWNRIPVQHLGISTYILIRRG